MIICNPIYSVTGYSRDIRGFMHPRYGTVNLYNHNVLWSLIWVKFADITYVWLSWHICVCYPSTLMPVTPLVNFVHCKCVMTADSTIMPYGHTCPVHFHFARYTIHHKYNGSNRYPYNKIISSLLNCRIF